MKKINLLGMMLSGIFFSLIVFNSCNNDVYSIQTSNASASKVVYPIEHKIPSKIWKEYAQVQTEMSDFMDEWENLDKVENQPTQAQIEKHALRSGGMLNKVLTTFDEVQDGDTICNNEPVIDDSTVFMPQSVLAYIQKTHTPMFYNIMKVLLNEDYLDINAKDIANSKDLTDDEKLRLLIIYPDCAKSKKIASAKNNVNSKEDDCKYHLNLSCSICTTKYSEEVATACMKSGTARRQAILKAKQDFEECSSVAFDAFKKCMGLE
jgi:hypothetical protein